MSFMAGHQALLMRIDKDPLWAFVKSLMHFDSTVVDSAQPTNSWALSGATLTTDPAKILSGSGALSCQNSTSDRIFLNPTTNIAIGTQDYCLEYWFRDDAVPGRNTFHFLLNTTNSIRVYNSATSTVALDVSGMTTSDPAFNYTTAAWHHIAVTRSGTVAKLYVDGALKQTFTSGAAIDHGASTQVWLGSGSSGGTSLQLLIDEWRVTVGNQRYTATFTPTYPFPNS